ncbi:metallophosphoesterase [Sphingomonas colocasiae]|uniref:Metallophosphoesterase n=1 Tax=Sphingomonas colocasiae TaxID=1848973 RepID=A0ABS7PY38_9SPHN|nr:metallophosphoesterase [Sphingomonas colocasiae]MBY8826270.1 metallophosphoesterase [Sphingomonas colocasiae]
MSTPELIDASRYPSPEAADATAIYAVGDVHGRLDLLEEIEAAIATDIVASRPLRPVICYLGDYVDRGPASAQVIDRLATPFGDGVARVFLKGNHEDRMLEFLEAPAAAGPAWLQYGGREALESYGVSVPDRPDGPDWTDLRDALSSALPPTHILFLRALRLAFAWRGHLFVHAGLDPARPVHAQHARDLMWIREPFLSADRDWGVRVVHGHVIVDEPVFRPNRIGIDTGAYHSGRLTCLVVSDDGTRLIQTGR